MHKYQLVKSWQLDAWKRTCIDKDGPLTCIKCRGYKLVGKGVGEVIRYTGSSYHSEYIMNPCSDCSGTGDLEDTFDNRILVAACRLLDQRMFEELTGEVKNNEC